MSSAGTPGAAMTGLARKRTSYGSLSRLPWLESTPWRLAILDEAQAIKNPQAKQTRAAESLRVGKDPLDP